jgi:hypothetical protein
VASAFFTVDARWFSTVRWLVLRSAAIFLLGWPATTISMIWRGLRVGLPPRSKASYRQIDSLVASRDARCTDARFRRRGHLCNGKRKSIDASKLRRPPASSWQPGFPRRSSAPEA